VTRRRPSLETIRAIFFDLDGTLRHSRPSNDQALFEIASAMGLTRSDEQRRQLLRWGHYYWAQSDELDQDLAAFGKNTDGLLTNYVRRFTIILGCEPERAAALAPEMYRRLTETHLQKDWVPPEVPQTLGRLQKAGLILAVVSNREKPLGDLLKRLGLDAYLSFGLASCEVDSWKPDVRIFQRAAELAGVSPEQAMYVGDNYFTDVLGAQRAGFNPVLLDPEGVFPEADCPVIRSIRELGQSLG
jgi:HAD superfamily hydrolase (TIGR01549 family)